MLLFGSCKAPCDDKGIMRQIFNLTKLGHSCATRDFNFTSGAIASRESCVQYETLRCSKLVNVETTRSDNLVQQNATRILKLLNVEKDEPANCEQYVISSFVKLSKPWRVKSVSCVHPLTPNALSSVKRESTNVSERLMHQAA